MRQILGYSNYYYNSDTNQIIRKATGEIVTLSKIRGKYVAKLKNDKNEWKSVSLTTIKSLAGIRIDLPENAQVIKGTDKYYIDTEGNVYSFSKYNPSGKKLKPLKSKNGYIYVIIDGKHRSVHSLMLNTFVYKKDGRYEDEGLVCLHLDNDKANNNLTNLKLSTYSENNKQAYSDELNKSKKYSITHGILSSNRIDWNKYNLEQLVAEYNGNNKQIAKHIGCSDKMIAKKRKQLNLTNNQLS